MFDHFKTRKIRKETATKLYQCILEKARAPHFYNRCSVPDTLDGRFELVLMHAFLAWDRLGREGVEGRALSQALFDVMFTDMNQALRNIGVGDLAVPHHIKRMMKAFKGRAHAYKSALENPDEESLPEVLRRNLFGTLDHVDEEDIGYFSFYLRENRNFLAGIPSVEILAGKLEFTDLTQDIHDTRMVA